MKIGIITQPLYKNYGGILQNYALQQVLKRMGHKPITMVGQFHSIWMYRYLLLRTYIFKSERKFRKHLIHPHNNPDIPLLTWKFVYKHINLSPYYSHSEATVRKEKLDAIIVGSDQVWRPKYNNGTLGASLYANYLEHCQNLTIKKVAYAASFGSSKWEYTNDQESMCAKLIQQFDAVSVREESGVDLCREHLKRDDAVCVLDPTLLLDKSDYESLCRKIKKKKHKRKMLLAYILDPTDEIINDLNNLAKRESMDLNLIYADDKISLSVEEWLSQFRDADAVITNSYHGTIFSIIFGKPYYTIVNEERGIDRYASLFSKLKISNSSYGIDVPNKIKKPEWDIIYNNILNIRSRSIIFLKNVLN